MKGSLPAAKAQVLWLVHNMTHARDVDVTQPQNAKIAIPELPG